MFFLDKPYPAVVSIPAMLLALDIAVITGWADATKSGIVDFSPERRDEPRLFHEFRQWLASKLADYDQLIIESAFVSPRPGIQALVTLNGIARMVAYEAEIRGRSLTVVAPAKWRRELFGPDKLKRKEAKERAIIHTAALRRFTQDDNEAEAICLFDYQKRIDGR